MFCYSNHCFHSTHASTFLFLYLRYTYIFLIDFTLIQWKLAAGSSAKLKSTACTLWLFFNFFTFFYNVKKSVHKQMHMLHMPLWLLEEVKRLPNELTGFGRLFNLFHAFSLFLYPLKTSRIYVFRGGYKETSGMKWVNCGTKLAMGLPNYWYKVKTERCDNYWSWGTSGGKWKNACTFISFKISILNFKTP